MKKKLQFSLAVLLVLVGVRVALIYHSRHADLPGVNQPPLRRLGGDDFVAPRRSHAYDQKSAAKELAGHSAWIRLGNSRAFYPYNPSSHRSDFQHEAGLLTSLQRLEVTDVVQETAPEIKGRRNSAGGQPLRAHGRQLMMVFTTGDNGGGQYSAPIGSAQDTDYTLYINDLLLLQDPHELYKHWSAETWDAIGKHEVRRGMNELQTSFSLGAGTVRSGTEYGNRTLVYANAGKATVVTFSEDKAVQVIEEQAP